MRVCAAPNSDGLAFDRVAVDCARHLPYLWRNPAQQSALADLRRFGRLAAATIMSAEMVAWVGDGCTSGADTAAVDGLLDLVQSIYRMRSR
ncbi:hypothetical protein GALL_424570 [mine drainage metagenome]|uniref:Uncharacterized protein n=1 Tax=mine drainage metagenome TaxID=410659 RepID=A0A1J5QIP1_9ZZZZ